MDRASDGEGGPRAEMAILCAKPFPMATYRYRSGNDVDACIPRLAGSPMLMPMTARGPDLGGKLARQPAQIMVCERSLCARHGAAPPGVARYGACARHRRNDPA